MSVLGSCFKKGNSDVIDVMTAEVPINFKGGQLVSQNAAGDIVKFNGSRAVGVATAIDCNNSVTVVRAGFVRVAVAENVSSLNITDTKFNADGELDPAGTFEHGILTNKNIKNDGVDCVSSPSLDGRKYAKISVNFMAGGTQGGL
ncbi:MAG: hypothetical protein ACRCYP_00920 [Alphaproteobacteria bacterium]